MNTTHQGILTLLRSAITGEKLPLPEGFTLEAADSLIRSQSLLPLAYQGAYNCGISANTPLMGEYKNHYFHYLIRSERQMQAVRRLYRAFEENGIDYLPVKGCNMKLLYPQPELRPMSDADILIRTEQYEKIKPIMEKLGYAEDGESEHELIWRSRDLHLELHKCLFAKSEKDLRRHFGVGWELAEKLEGHRFGLRREDEYLYLFTHMTKHYRFSGIGCRHILDLYVYRRAYPELDETYIETAVRKLDLAEFYHNIQRLLAVWFMDAQTDEKTAFIGSYIMSGGNWGDLETRFCTEEVKRSAGGRSGTGTRAGRFLRAIFPPVEKLQHDYRILFQYPWLYPLFWIPRWIRGIVRRPGEILRKFRTLDRVSDEKVQARRDTLEYVGLDFRFQEE